MSACFVSSLTPTGAIWTGAAFADPILLDQLDERIVLLSNVEISQVSPITREQTISKSVAVIAEQTIKGLVEKFRQAFAA